MKNMTPEWLDGYKKKQAGLKIKSDGVLRKSMATMNKKMTKPINTSPHNNEHEVQVSFIKWVEDAAKYLYPSLMLGYAIPNGGQRNIIVAKKLKEEGVVSGVPDWHLPIARKIWIGLWIEFKHGKNKLSENQKSYITLLREEGHLVEVCYTSAEAIKLVERYLEIKS